MHLLLFQLLLEGGYLQVLLGDLLHSLLLHLNVLVLKLAIVGLEVEQFGVLVAHLLVAFVLLDPLVRSVDLSDFPQDSSSVFLDPLHDIDVISHLVEVSVNRRDRR